MSQLTIKLSDKADALIAQLQKEIFNRRRKKVTAAGVVETLVESGAKSQSDKRFATSWKNLISDIEKAAKLANAHGAKPANLSDAEWALILSHRSRSSISKAAPKKAAPKKASAKKASPTTTKRAAVKAKPAAKTTAVKKAAPKKAASTAAKAKAKPAAAAKPKVAPKAKPVAKKAARNPVKKTGVTRAGGSVAKRMAKAVGRLGGAPSTNGSNGAAQLTSLR